MSYRIKLTGNVKSYSNGYYTATKERPYVEVDDKAAADAAVSTGLFVLVDEPEEDAMPLKGEYVPEESASGKVHLDTKQLSSMKYDELRRLAEDMGIDVSSIRKKAELVAAIAAEEVEYPEDGDGEEVPDGIFG